METLLGPISGWLIGIVVILGGTAAAWFKGRQMGKQAERDKQLRERMKARETKDEIREDIAREDPDKKREELSRWDM